MQCHIAAIILLALPVGLECLIIAAGCLGKGLDRGDQEFKGVAGHVLFSLERTHCNLFIVGKVDLSGAATQPQSRQLNQEFAERFRAELRMTD